MKTITTLELCDKTGIPRSTVNLSITRNRGYLESLGTLEKVEVPGRGKAKVHYILNKDHVLFLAGRTRNNKVQPILNVYNQMDDVQIPVQVSDTAKTSTEVAVIMLSTKNLFSTNIESWLDRLVELQLLSKEDSAVVMRKLMQTMPTFSWWNYIYNPNKVSMKPNWIWKSGELTPRVNWIIKNLIHG